MNQTASSLTGNLLDDTCGNPIPYKHESRPRPDCVNKASYWQHRFRRAAVMNWKISSLMGNLRDDTWENPVPYKYDSRPRPDCVNKASYWQHGVWRAAVVNLKNRRWWLTCLVIPERTVNHTNTNRDRHQIVQITLLTDNTVFDALRWWIEKPRHWRVTCLMIPERTLYHTNTNRDRHQIVQIKVRTDNTVFDAVMNWRWIEKHRHWRVTCLMIPEGALCRNKTHHDRDQIVR